ncbi:hypothetical protein HED55_15045 [Ochrobactrum haematophilum]|uniref:Uncharacterized protein n=1 Tax=Brucella haematophila TaxID=419474 RepID=A0ABX1DM87_9HYPH|nr:hypothetical protein [Brucella haematophila]
MRRTVPYKNRAAPCPTNCAQYFSYSAWLSNPMAPRAQALVSTLHPADQGFLIYIYFPAEPFPAERVNLPGGTGMSLFVWFISAMMFSLFALIGFTVWTEKNRD